MEEVITSKLKGAIDDISTLIVREDGAACSGSWVIVVVAESFGPLGPLDRARKVNGILADEIKKMHAVTVSRRRDVSLFFLFLSLLIVSQRSSAGLKLSGRKIRQRTKNESCSFSKSREHFFIIFFFFRYFSYDPRTSLSRKKICILGVMPPAAFEPTFFFHTKIRTTKNKNKSMAP